MGSDGIGNIVEELSLESTGAFDQSDDRTRGDSGVGGVFEDPGDIGQAVASLDLGDEYFAFVPLGVLNGDGGVHILGSMSSRL